MRNTKYIGLILVIIIFGFIFIPKIVSRITNSKIVESNRSQSSIPLQYVFLNGEAKKVPEFAFLNQDSIIISNEDFNKKVYVAEFFFTSCPSICPIPPAKSIMPLCYCTLGHHPTVDLNT